MIMGITTVDNFDSRLVEKKEHGKNGFKYVNESYFLKSSAKISGVYLDIQNYQKQSNNQVLFFLLNYLHIICISRFIYFILFM